LGDHSSPPPPQTPRAFAACSATPPTRATAPDAPG
jgi:hypothetical protein